MTEKNTLSILQNIKKKMQKFDQEPKRIETFSGIDDEFEYISPAQQKASEIKSETEVALPNQEEMLDIDKELQLAAKPSENKVEESPAVSVKESVTSVEDDSIGDDLGLDDLEEKPLDSAQEQNVEDVSGEENLDLDNDEKQSESEEVETHIEDDVDDLIVESESADEEAEKKSETLKNNQTENDEFEFDLDLDEELDLDEDEKDDVKNIPLASQKPSQVKLSNEAEEDLELAELLKDEEVLLDSKSEKPETEENLDDILDDSEVASDPAQSQSPQNKIDDLDDIDLDELDEIANKMEVDTNSKAAAQKDFDTELEEDNKNITENQSDRLSNEELSKAATNILETKMDAWLDKNLRGLVESIVQQEVKKLFERR